MKKSNAKQSVIRRKSTKPQERRPFLEIEELESGTAVAEIIPEGAEWRFVLDPHRQLAIGFYKPPSLFHRLMWRLLLGARWEKLEE